MTLLYFAPVAWDSYEQRPHYWARDFLQSGGATVVWIDPYPSRLPAWRDLRRSDWRDPPLTLARPAGLTAVRPGGWPIDPLAGGPGINARLFWNRLFAQLRGVSPASDTVIGIGRPTALALAALEHIGAAYRFYDAMDEFPEFYRGRSREAARQIEAAIVRRVDRVFASSTHLYDKFLPLTGASRLTLLANAYDMALLPPVPAERPAAPCVGFVGCMGGWFDWPLVVRLADALSPGTVVLIGPLASRPPSRLPANVRIEPPCSQPDGVRRLASFSAGLIPFVRSPLTAGMDSIKFYQYRAAGLPVLSTRFGGMAERGARDGVFFLDDPAGLERAIRDALAYQPMPGEIAQFRAAHTWTARFRSARVWAATARADARP